MTVNLCTLCILQGENLEHFEIHFMEQGREHRQFPSRPEEVFLFHTVSRMKIASKVAQLTEILVSSKGKN